MHKDNIKVNWKVAMRKIKQQWGEFSADQIAQIQGSFEDNEWRKEKQQHFMQLHLKALKN